MKYSKIILISIFLIIIILLNLLNNKNNIIEGIEEYYPKESYFNSKENCNNFCNKLILKGDNTKCTNFNDDKNIKCYDNNNFMRTPLCEYVEKNKTCRFNESYNKRMVDLINRKKPWGIYDAKDWDINSNVLKDTSGRNNHATTEGVDISGNKSGNGAMVDIPFIQGSTTSKVIWPIGSIPTNFTICSITRYTGNKNNKCILTSTSYGGNWTHGHWNNKKGIANYNRWKTNRNSSNTVGQNTDWLIMCGKNGNNDENIKYESKEGNIIADNKRIGIDYGGDGGGQLCINHIPGEESDWALSYVIIWDKLIEEEEMRVFCELLKAKIKIGKII